jgi:hypothetical protein
MRTLFQKTGIKYSMLERNLNHMYQQWRQGNNNYISRYMEFVEMVSRMNNLTTEASLTLLENTYWFRKPNNFPRIG